MAGHAVTHGGVSIVNALATGRGASLAVDLPLSCTVELTDEPGTVEVTVEDHPDLAPDAVVETVREVLKIHGVESTFGAHVTTRSEVPVSRGLKSSSAATVAAALATDAAVAHHEDGERLGRAACLEASVEASLRAGVTVTGAWDDASAALMGGVCVTHNPKRELLHRYEVPEDLRVVLHVPPRQVATREAAELDHDVLTRAASLAHELALEERWLDALQVNGLAYGALYGLPADVPLAAVGAGAHAAGVTGTGPAVAAVAPMEHADAIRDAWSPLDGDLLTVPPVNDPAEVTTS